jgi:hypothetical protein
MPSHAVNQIEPLGKVGMLADRGDQSLELDLLALLQAGKILLPEPLDLRIAAALDPVLEAGDILADLIHHGQLLGERLQSGGRCGMDLTYSRGAVISLAAEHNTAFIGNEGNRRIVEMILNKAIGAATGTDSVPRAIYDFVSLDTPTVREVINSGERTPREFIELLSSANSFKKWLNEQNPDKDLIQEMLREKTKSGWLEALPVKVARFGLFSGAGLFTDMAVPGSSIALAAVDNFLVSKLINKWRPHFFVENKLRGFLDTQRG